MKVNLIMDVSNLFYSAFYAHSKETEEVLLAMANKSFMDSINKHFKDHKCDEVVLAFDGKKNWRKSYTKNAPDPKNEDCLTYKKYKGQRREKMTDSERAKLERFDEHVVEFRQMLQEYTGLLVLQHDRLEADDLIAGFIRSHQKEAHIIISRDRDYLQLQRFKNVKQIDPHTGKNVTLADYNFDPDYFMFLKCFRGDDGDNVMSAYPRVWETKIKAAYEDDYARNALMKHQFEVDYLSPVDGSVIRRKYLTEDVFEENEMLMDLTKQPDVIVEMIDKSIKKSYDQRGSYNMVKFLRYCGRMDFQHIIHNIQAYNKLLKGPGKNPLFD